MSSDKRLDKEDPIVIDLLQRVSRLEERTNNLEKVIESLKERVESIDGRTWLILASIILSIIIQILFKVVK
jgi:hypothetical protein